MHNEVVFYNQAIQQRQGLEVRNPGEMARVALYINRTCALAKTFHIENFPRIELPRNFASLTPEAILPQLYDLENFMNQLYARHVFEIDSSLNQDRVLLDDNWRSKVSSYISHIRDVVSKADDLPEGLRQSIMNRLNSLQAEVDRNRTRVTAAMDILVELTQGISEGAKNLEPAVKLTERIVGSLNSLRRKSNSEETRKLPAPESLGLPSVDDANEVRPDGEES